ncbi:MAG: ribonuclease P protein component [Phycisphaerales bacterium]|nr:ribonuclease P protein component [Phycisphaerales bacterium]
MIGTSELASARSTFWRLPRTRRVTRPSEFRHIYGNGQRTRKGPYVFHALPNELGHPRLGLSVSRKVGNAVIRNRVKRRLREAFRHLQHELPGSYDLVITVQPHEVRSMPDCTTHLRQAAEQLHDTWTQKTNNPNATDTDSPTQS